MTNESLKAIAKDIIKDFQKRIKIFRKINIIFKTKDVDDRVGEYEYNSSLDGSPTIYVYLDTLKSFDDEIEDGLKETILHELAHAICNIDNHYIFVEDENILQYEDEEQFCEDFAFNFNMFGTYPKEIDELTELFVNKKWIAEEND